MPIPRLKRIHLASVVVCAMFLGSPHFTAMAGEKPPRATRLAQMPESQQQSRITSVTIAGSEPAGTFGGVAYRRVWGNVFGLVTPRDTIRGFDQLPHGADGNYGYESEFEIIAPEKAGTNSVIFVEVENRGNPNFLNTVHGSAETGAPSGLGTGSRGWQRVSV